MIRTIVETCREYCLSNFCKIKDPKQSVQQDKVIRKEALVIGVASYSEVENYGFQCLL